MNPNRLILVGIGALVVVGLAAVAMSGGNTGPDVADLERAPVDAVAIKKLEQEALRAPKPDAPETEDPVGPNGQAIAAMTTGGRRQGIPSRPDGHDPVRGTDWDRNRAAMDERWHDEMIQNVQKWAGSQSMSKSQRSEITDRVAAFTKSVLAVRDEARSGMLERKETRAELDRLREEMAQDATEIIGRAESDALNLHLQKTMVGGGW